MNDAITIGRAEPGDAIAISSVLATSLDDSGLFQESADAVAHSLADFFVARNDAGTIVGCPGLHRDSRQLAEVYAVAVKPQYQRQGIGGELMRACQQHAISSGIRDVWLATMKPEYFSRYGFQPVSRWGCLLLPFCENCGKHFSSPARVGCPPYSAGTPSCCAHSTLSRSRISMMRESTKILQAFDLSVTTVAGVCE